MNNVEIELKAHIKDADLVLKKLEAIGFKRIRAYDKHDVYYSLTDKPKLDLRLRRDDDKTYLTFKDKKLDAGIEQNTEFESLIETPETMIELLKRIGFVERIQKHKRGFAYKKGDLLAEVSLVERLGWFIELEIILEENIKPDLIQKAKESLKQVLKQLDISLSAIEARPYTKMLAEILEK